MIRAILLSLAFFVLSSSAQAQSESQSAIEKGTELRLESQLKVCFKYKSASDFFAHLKSRYQIQLLISQSGKDLGLQPEKFMFSRETKNQPIRATLEVYLDTYKATYLIRDNLIILVDKDNAEYYENLRLRVYNFRDLLRKWKREAANPFKPIEYSTTNRKPLSSLTKDDLTELVQNYVEPNSWEATEGLGMIQWFGDSLIVRQTEVAHVKIKQLLSKLKNNLIHVQ